MTMPCFVYSIYRSDGCQVFRVLRGALRARTGRPARTKEFGRRGQLVRAPGDARVAGGRGGTGYDIGPRPRIVDHPGNGRARRVSAPRAAAVDQPGAFI
jgi:hypothetical protein